jgi:hypothetical protein
VFGCRMFALPARPRRPDKLHSSDARTGIFLGFSKTFKNILYYDVDTETVKTAQHVVFDKTMADQPSPPPNARLLALTSLSNDVPASVTDAISFPDVHIRFSPFYDTSAVVIDLDLTHNFPLGFEIATCSTLHRAFISVLHRSHIPRLSLRSFRTKFLGAYIVTLHESPVFYPRDVDSILDSLRALAHPPPTIALVLAPERKTDISRQSSPPLHLRRIDIRNISNLCPPDLPSMLVSRLLTTPMTDEERQLTKLTRARLQRLSNWPEWDKSFDKQLDAHYRDGALGPPVLIADLTSSLVHRPQLLRFHWTCLVKTDGTRKARACIDGSQRAVPWLREDAPTYASCIEQPAMKLFFGLCALYCLIVTIGDSDNAYQQSPPPSKPCHMAIDAAYRSWFRKLYAHDIDPTKYAIPVTGAIQGHPEAGRLWQDFIVSFYLALKNIARYLRATADWGILYWRPSPPAVLPAIPFAVVPVDPDLPPFPTISLHELVGFVDASHAACQVTRASFRHRLCILSCWCRRCLQVQASTCRRNLIDRG